MAILNKALHLSVRGEEDLYPHFSGGALVNWARHQTQRFFKAALAGAAVLVVGLVSDPAAAQQQDSDLMELYGGMKWRLIGPYRGGRVLAVTGVPGDPNVYYFGAVAGGVWKTTDAGSTWQPLFDKEPISSIGGIAVAESDPNVIYVGTGETCIRGNIVSFGDGVYKAEITGFRRSGPTAASRRGALARRSGGPSARGPTADPL